jgi:hypothetical protein
MSVQQRSVDPTEARKETGHAHAAGVIGRHL